MACLSKENNEADNTQVNILRQQVSTCIAGEYWLGNVHIVYPGASLGIVSVDPLHIDADGALRAADAEMYRDKKEKSKTRFLPLD